MVDVKIRAKQDCPYKGYFRGDVFDATKQNEEEYSFMDKAYRQRYRPIEEFDIVDGQGPVRTVTRKEIAPGTYGIVQVTSSREIKIQLGKYSADKLREAAHILNQIAEAMEDGTTF